MIRVNDHKSMSYCLIDSGNGYRLEKVGNNVLARPDSTCVWNRQYDDRVWDLVHAVFQKKSNGRNSWAMKNELKEPWLFHYTLPKGDHLVKKITCQLRMSPGSKNVGIFPEQVWHWDYISNILSNSTPGAKVLNLFGYTGAGTLVAAASGAEVCHVDSSKSSVEWAKENQHLSKLDDAPIRWIVDDCLTFLKREIKRGNKYDGIILDPPAFGHDPRGKKFTFEEQIHPLLEACSQLLSKKQLFMIVNAYAMNYAPSVTANLLNQYFKQDVIQYGTLDLETESGLYTVSCNAFARFTSLAQGE